MRQLRRATHMPCVNINGARARMLAQQLAQWNAPQRNRQLDTLSRIGERGSEAAATTLRHGSIRVLPYKRIASSHAIHQRKFAPDIEKVADDSRSTELCSALNIHGQSS